MLKALLFDLDGTLLPMDTHHFVQEYIKLLAEKMADRIEPHSFVKALLQSTQEMIQNTDATRTNEQVFVDRFLKATQLEKEKIWPLLDQFYEEVFPSLSYVSQPTPMAKKVVAEAVKQGYLVAVATNPVFPRAAIYNRLEWADVADLPFEVVTVYEESYFTKPHTQYYQAICDQLRLPPEQCLMVGNDVQEDMSSSQIGMKTFLVEGHVIDRGSASFPIDDRGSLEELYQKIKQSQGLFQRNEKKLGNQSSL